MRRYALLMIRMLAALGLAMFAFANPTLAQNDDDDDDDGTEYGAFIYEGTVDDYGDRPVEDLEGLDSVRDDDDDDDDNDNDDDRDVWDVIGNDDPEPDPLYGEDDEDIDPTIDELTSEPHVLVVHADDDPDSDVIAIGAIEGDLDDEDGLMIDLEEVDDSGFEGRAYFQPDSDDNNDDDDDDNDDDDGDDQTDVTVGIWEVTAQGV